MNRNLPVVLKLEGGLGNQLFQFAAGYYLAGKLGVDLEIDQYGLPMSSVRGEKTAGILEFDLVGNSPVSINLRSRQISKINAHLASKFLVFNKGLLKIHMHTSRPMRLSIFSESTDDVMLALRRPVKLHGNFQSWKIVSAATEYGFPKSLELVSKSLIWKRLRETYDIENSFAIHLRLGDDAINNFGYSQPSSHFYQSSLEILHKEFEFHKPVFIFSDEIEKAREYVSSHLRIQSPVFIDGHGSTSAEILYVMSKFAGIICANSTFSCWAGWSIGNKGGRVIVPVPFSDFDNKGSREFPNNWLRLKK